MVAIVIILYAIIVVTVIAAVNTAWGGFNMFSGSIVLIMKVLVNEFE